MADDQLTQLQERLIESTAEIERLKAKSTTTLSGAEFMTILMVFPVILSFVILGVIIVWKTTSNPSVVAPHLDIILVSFAIFANPVTAAAGVITGLLVDSEKKKKE